MTIETAYIGLGSNLPSIAGSPQATLTAAINRLASLGTVTAQSSFYETEPVGKVDQPRFLNAVVAIETDLDPIHLLDRLLAIELEFGRDRSQTQAKGPRTLDLDLLLMEEHILNKDRLILPHRDVAKRRFVLAPLAEIAPNTVHPVLGRTIITLLDELRDEGQNRIAAVNISLKFPPGAIMLEPNEPHPNSSERPVRNSRLGCGTGHPASSTGEAGHRSRR